MHEEATTVQAESPADPSVELTVERVRAALGDVRYPGVTRDLVSFGMVQGVSVCGTQVKVTLGLRVVDPTVPAQLDRAITERLVAFGATSVAVVIEPPAPVAMPAHRGTPDPWSDQVRLASARHVIAVGAGKGGVGKSTIAVNLALALAREGLRTALLDADIYGPSLPILLGIEDGASRIHMTQDRHIVPLETHGIPLVSFGFFLGESSPAIWRGPMVSKAVKQFARGVAWPELDVLVVDLPPGTGDIPLSLAQAVELSGAVVVTQPPRVAAAEARKAVDMFRSLEVRVLGVVENMTGPFGAGAGQCVADALDVPFLGTVPFDEQVVVEGDDGTPTVVARPNSFVARRVDAIAREIAHALGWQHAETSA